MFDWARRETLLDVSVNAVPVVILAAFVVLSAVTTPWSSSLRSLVLAHALTAVPILVLVPATYLAARAIEADAARAAGSERPEPTDSGVVVRLYTPDGAFEALLAVLAATLLAAVGYLVAFTTAGPSL